MKFLNTLEDCQWLRATALKNNSPMPEFRSFILHGNEDCPTKLELYEWAVPYAHHVPAIYVYDSAADNYKLDTTQAQSWQA